MSKKRYIYWILIILLNWSGKAFSQKKVIDSIAYAKWEHIDGNAIISNDGKFFLYNLKLGSDAVNFKTIIQSTNSKWKIEFEDVRLHEARFSFDSSYFLFITNKDSLGILDLRSKTVKFIQHVNSFNLGGQSDWINYLVDNKAKSSILMNLKTGKAIHFDLISSSWLSADGKTLILIKKVPESMEETQSLLWYDIESESMINIWTGANLEYIVLDFNHQQLAFKGSSSLFYYRHGNTKPKPLIISNRLNSNTATANITPKKFSEAGDRLFVEMESRTNIANTVNEDKLEIWSYRDSRLQSVQIKDNSRLNESKDAVIDLNDCRIIPLQKYQNESLLTSPYKDVAISFHQIGDGDYREVKWNSSSQKIYTVVNTKTGIRKDVDHLNEDSQLSPNNKYVITFDQKNRSYLSYNVSTGKTVDLTSLINTTWVNVLGSDFKYLTRGVAGWLPNDEAVLIYDSYDIWKLDPSGKHPATNLTNGYGQRNHIVFSLALYKDKQTVLSDEKSIILTAFDINTKDNGFFIIEEKGGRILRKLSLGPFIYKINSVARPFDLIDFQPLKAIKSEEYLVRRMTSGDAPNYFSTIDFKTFNRLTNFEPHKEYNWYTSEVHNWISLDGRKLQGILYKPENFDPSKKYPIIFYYYERLSDALNGYLMPKSSFGSIDIPTYVSKGYLVFCPDIYYKAGDPMQGAYDAVVSAASHLSNFTYVNSKKMGIQGHSWGGVETNYLVCHTNLFVAACSASGLSDWISGYGSLYGNQLEGYSNTLGENFESGQNRMASSLWDNKGGYIKNSSVLYVDSITTPLLLMHTKKDKICPFPNILEFFLGLRRLGKQAWMLVYPESDHSLSGEESKDFTTRMEQFFNFYLKNEPAPLWMLDQIKFPKKRFESSLKLDSIGRTPGPGLSNVLSEGGSELTKEKKSLKKILN